MTDAEDTNRLEELFARAVELAPDERAAFLQRECAANTGLRARLLYLICHATDSACDARLHEETTGEVG